MADEVTAEGVPEMAPVEESRERPAGSEGETDQPVMAPPVAEGVTVVMAVPLVNVKAFGLKVKEDGATSFTTIVTSAVLVPPVLLAVTV